MQRVSRQGRSQLIAIAVYLALLLSLFIVAGIVRQLTQSRTRAPAPEVKWEDVTDPSEVFTVKMPGQPKYTTEEVDTGNGIVTHHRWELEDKEQDTGYFFSCWEQPCPFPDLVFGEAQRSLVAKMGMSLSAPAKELLLPGGHKGQEWQVATRELSIPTPSGRVYARIYAVPVKDKTRFYLMAASVPGIDRHSPQICNFLDGLVFRDAKLPLADDWEDWRSPDGDLTVRFPKPFTGLGGTASWQVGQREYHGRYRYTSRRGNHFHAGYFKVDKGIGGHELEMFFEAVSKRILHSTLRTKVDKTAFKFREKHSGMQWQEMVLPFAGSESQPVTLLRAVIKRGPGSSYVYFAFVRGLHITWQSRDVAEFFDSLAIESPAIPVLKPE